MDIYGEGTEKDCLEALIAELDQQIENAASDYQELTRLLEEKEAQEGSLLELMEQWEQANLEIV